jgi:hypothetical protein
LNPRTSAARDLGIGGRLAVLIALAFPATARAAPPETAAPASEPGDRTRAEPEELGPEKSRQRLRLLTEPGAFVHTLASLMFGDGLRFNNPYRLAHELGASGQSLSLTAPYVDLAIALAGGNPEGLMHGGRLGWSVAMTGVPQGVVTPAYLVAVRPSASWLLHAWVGAPLVTAPDFNVGAELAAAGTFFVRAGVGASAALVADAFYGAGTRERRAVFYPVLSAQLGVSLHYEMLP